MSFENLNKLLYTSKSAAYTLLRIFSISFSIASVAVLIYAYGFYHELEELKDLFFILNFLFGTYVINYLVRLLYSFHRIEFLNRNWFEGVLMVIIIFNMVFLHFFEIRPVHEAYQMLITNYFFVLIVFEFIKISTKINKIRLEPATTFIASFVILIGMGTLLLMLPASTVGTGSMPFIDALFTSTSASCVTGLIVVDTGTYFTFKGHFILLCLIQMGGLGIITFATFFSSFFAKGTGIKHQSMMQNLFSSESLLSAQGLFKQIIVITLLIEGIFAVAIYFTWGNEVYFENLGQKIFYSVFHSVSAFCNAGFSLFTDGLYAPEVRKAYMLHLAVAFTIIFGGLGFPVIEDIFSLKNLRDRLAFPWKDWKLSSKVAIYTSAALIVFGMVAFFLLEKNNTLNEMNFMERVITSFFQSVTTRTAGYNTVDFTKLTEPIIIVMIFLMFIGGSSASTAGGIKTSTFYIIVVSAIATIRERLRVEIGHRTIPNDLIFKAYSLFAFAVTFNFIAVFLLTITEQGAGFLNITFEQISAFGTVGLSTGLTPKLSVAGKIIIITSMFVGRVGLLTLALTLSRRVVTTSYRYPNAHIMIG
ncbi:MAG TPA: potassium transporter TrkG [Cytophagaceae bacterium]|nr:potassium transporter TrkG [Cytophagaceae bacterium]